MWDFFRNRFQVFSKSVIWFLTEVDTFSVYTFCYIFHQKVWSLCSAMQKGFLTWKAVNWDNNASTVNKIYLEKSSKMSSVKKTLDDKGKPLQKKLLSLSPIGELNSSNAAEHSLPLAIYTTMYFPHKNVQFHSVMSSLVTTAVTGCPSVLQYYNSMHIYTLSTLVLTEH